MIRTVNPAAMASRNNKEKNKNLRNQEETLGLLHKGRIPFLLPLKFFSAIAPCGVTENIIDTCMRYCMINSIEEGHQQACIYNYYNENFQDISNSNFYRSFQNQMSCISSASKSFITSFDETQSQPVIESQYA